MISHEELESILRQFGGPLEIVNVDPVSALVPHLCAIRGACSLHGAPHYWSVDEFNLRNISGPEDILRLAGMILQSFQKAASH